MQPGEENSFSFKLSIHDSITSKSFLLPSFFYFLFFEIRTCNMRSTLLGNVYHIQNSTANYICTILYSRSLGFTHLALLNCVPFDQLRPHPPALAITILLSASLSLTILDASYKWACRILIYMLCFKIRPRIRIAL